MKKSTVAPILGRHFLNVAQLEKFACSAEAEQKLSQRSFADIKENLVQMRKFSAVEVNVVEVKEGMGVCQFYLRGPMVYQMEAPVSCLTQIKPVTMKGTPPVSLFAELDRLAHA